MLKQTIRESLMNEGTILTNEQMGFVLGGSNKGCGNGGGKSGNGGGRGGHGGGRGGYGCGW